MFDHDAYRTVVHDYRTGRGWSQADLANRSGVSLATISRIERGEDVTPRPSVTRRIAFALGREAGTRLLEAAGLADDTVAFVDDHPDEVEAWITRDLTADQVKQLRAYADFLRSQ